MQGDKIASILNLPMGQPTGPKGDRFWLAAHWWARQLFQFETQTFSTWESAHASRSPLPEGTLKFDVLVSERCCARRMSEPLGSCLRMARVGPRAQTHECPA